MHLVTRHAWLSQRKCMRLGTKVEPHYSLSHVTVPSHYCLLLTISERNSTTQNSNVGLWTENGCVGKKDPEKTFWT